MTGTGIENAEAASIHAELGDLGGVAGEGGPVEELAEKVVDGEVNVLNQLAVPSQPFAAVEGTVGGEGVHEAHAE